MDSIISYIGTICYSLLYFNSRIGFNRLKCLYSVISVIVNSLQTNTKNGESTRSLTARQRSVHQGWRKYLYSVISVIVDSLPANIKNRESTHSWTARERSVHKLCSATNRWYVVKCASQKWNWSNNKSQWYNILVTFIFKFNCVLY